jgi:hypothetical protein
LASIGPVIVPGAMLFEEIAPVSWLAATLPATVAAVVAVLARIA